MRTLLTLAWILGALCALACRRSPELPVYGSIEVARLETSLGGILTTEDLDGRPHVVDFIFTSCGMACPMMTSKMRSLYDRFPPDAVRFLSVSTDPDVDTVARLHEYAAALGVDEERWIFGRASIEEVRRLSEKEFLLGASLLPAGHSQRFVLLDAERRIRGYYDSEDPEALARLESDLGGLLP